MTTATIVTSMGAFTVRLMPDHAPATVANFVGLATGTTPWTDPRTGERRADPLYSGTVFHRVIKDFMIQGGDPTGTGTGGPGYEFEDEFNQHKVERGALAMANAGPGTNGSQFFIVTTDAAPWLDGKHTVFGEVSDGMDVVDKIGTLPTDARDRPTQEARIERLAATA